MKMVERMARAMYVASSSNANPEQELNFIFGKPVHSTTANHYRRLALAALKAMREPTDAMKQAGSDRCDDVCRLGGGYQEDVFASMIDAAIKEAEAG